MDLPQIKATHTEVAECGSTHLLGKPQIHLHLMPRIASLLAGISIFLLRRETDARSVYVVLFVFFHVGPYLIAALAPMRWAAIQVGFVTGLSISTCPALLLLLVVNAGGFPLTSRTPDWAYSFAFAADLLLFAIVVISWVLRRGEISNRTAVRYLVFGLLYPFLAFAFTEVIAAPFVG
jgi:hypothetical protein